ncbi:MAG: hypothetical protein EOS30_23105 [Mesorhizobium sp.]|nr:MAG: hypothetical protein EOS30_23105 [Mesorhizobium sp.]
MCDNRATVFSFSPCGRRWPREARSDEGVPAWQKRRSVTHPSTVSALRADPPSPTGGEGKSPLQQPRLLGFLAQILPWPRADLLDHQSGCQ